MVVLVPKLAFSLKHSHKHHMISGTVSAAAQAFRSDVSSYLVKLSRNLKLGQESLSVKWLRECLEMVSMVNNSFAKMVVEMEYPMSEWKAESVEEYLEYSLNMLELLNSIKSSVSHLDHARVSILHALSLMDESPSLAVDRVKKVSPKHEDFNVEANGNGQESRKFCSEKEGMIHEALLVMKSITSWACGMVLCALNSNIRPYVEMKRWKTGVSFDCDLMEMDSFIGKYMEDNGGILKEVKEVNEAVERLTTSISGNEKGCYHEATVELETRLEALEKELNGLEQEESNLFRKVLFGRNELLETLRRKKQ